MRLRLARPDDVPRLAEILAEESVRLWWRDVDAARLVREDDGFVVECDGVIAGFVMVTEETEPDYRHAGLDVFLSTANQGRGLGPRVLREVIDRLAAQGHHRFQIDPSVDNARAIAAYRKVGFEPVGVLRAYERRLDGTWGDALLMDLVLPGVAH